jgi:methionyl-tRNA formyltransferase
VRTVFLGTSAFAVQVLTRLASSPHRPTLVLTRPDRPRGRGRQLAPPPVAECARELSLPLAQPERVGDPEARDQIAAEDPGAVVVCAFGALIRPPLLDAHPFVNVHPSLLPRWRGAAPIERALMAGDERTGVSIIALTEGLDSGPVFAMREVEVDAADTYGTLAPRLAELGGELLVEVLDRWPGTTREQGEDGLTYAEKITAEDRRLDPARPAAELAQIVRALSPHIGAFLELPDGERLGVRSARAVPESPAPGALSASADGTPVLGTAGGGLELGAVQPAGKREMPGADWWRGRR